MDSEQPQEEGGWIVRKRTTHRHSFPLPLEVLAWALTFFVLVETANSIFGR